ncbi:MAG: hypothetical protein BGO01_02920 [Armatimonadetes bacterium 55-13]|nr:DUF1275 domain-containing protein [Armatimonadota bacterium]OJU63611.1 MAG: hypothetical protein BGO01_02920 [Armatimonadetes bacterium 55-13]
MTRLDRRSLAFAIALPMLAGYVDSLGFLDLGGYFVSFMSGNSTRLGIGLGSGDWESAVTVLVIVFLFVFGVVVGSLIASPRSEKRRVLILSLVAGLLAVSGVLYATHHVRLGTAAMVIAMGAENTVLRRDGIGVGLTYMTGNLVKMGHAIADSIQGGSKKEWLRFLVLWVGLITGATLGAVAHRAFDMNALWFGSAFAAALAFVFRKGD